MTRDTRTATKHARLAASLGSAPLTLLVAHPILADPLDASGTGNDRADIRAVKLRVDANANGVVDAGPTDFIISYDF